MKHSRIFALLVALLALWPLGAAANMANPYQPGQAVGEPLGDLASVAIMGEALNIDLRPLANDDPAIVSAVYEVRLDGPAQQVQLEFVAAALSGTDNSGVWLDAQPVPFSTGAAEALPPSWQAPNVTPAVNGGEPLRYTARPTGTIRFTLNLEPGMHKIRVQYPAGASAFSGDSPARYWQLGYVLAPAREWKSFGGLTVEVLIPAGWRAASDPPLHRDNSHPVNLLAAQNPADTLSRTFQTLPADTLALTLQYPAGDPAGRHPVLVLLGALLVTIMLAVVAGRWLGRRGRRSLWALPLVLLAGLAWVLVDAYALTEATPSVPDTQRAWTYGYRSGSAALALAPVFCIAAIGLTGLLVVVSARLARRRSFSTSS